MALFLSPHTQVNTSPITKITSWLKFLGKNLHLVGCATLCAKSEVMLISSWQEYYKSGFFPKAEWRVAELIFLSLNNWGLNFLQNVCFNPLRFSSHQKNWLTKLSNFTNLLLLNDWSKPFFFQIAKCQMFFFVQ